MAAAALAAAVAFVSDAPSGAVVSVSGIPGTGKSCVLQLALAAGAFPRVLAFDPHARRDRIELALGNDEIHPWPGELVPYPELVARARTLLSRPRFRIVVDPGTLQIEDGKIGGRMVPGLATRFARVTELAFAAGGVDVIGEEAALYARGAVQAINLVSTGSRHGRVRLYLVSQRFMRVPIDARENLSHLVVFALGGAADLAELRARCGAGFEAEARRLVKGGPPLLWHVGQSLHGV
jgi:hypothetical protein